MKQCNKCHQWKKEVAFSPHRDGKNGLYGICKGCKNTTDRARRKTIQGAKAAKRSELAKRYNITLEQYNRMYEVQNGMCAICGKPETAKTKQQKEFSLSVDHDHRTEKIRGLLCSNCNNGLGRMKDSVKTLLQAALYLEQYSE